MFVALPFNFVPPVVLYSQVILIFPLVRTELKLILTATCGSSMQVAARPWTVIQCHTVGKSGRTDRAELNDLYVRL